MRQQHRTRWGLEVMAEAGHAGADATIPEGRKITADELMTRAGLFGLRSMRACVTCRARQKCELHHPTGETPVEPAKKEKKSASAIRYANAYAAGQTDASGEVFTPPTDSSGVYHLARLASVHGKPHTGDALLAWFRGISAEYRRAFEGGPDAKFQAGFSPRRCLAWLDGGRRKGAAPALSTRQAAPARRSRGQEEAI